MSEAVASLNHLASVRRRAILSCAVGNFFELFDFTIYGYFAVAITRAFYPSGSMYGTYAAFAAAFLMRPVGAVVIGAYGDRLGRRAVPAAAGRDVFAFHDDGERPQPGEIAQDQISYAIAPAKNAAPRLTP